MVWVVMYGVCCWCLVWMFIVCDPLGLVEVCSVWFEGIYSRGRLFVCSV